MPDPIGFPPGKTSDDFFSINGGVPPYRDWVWPPDFTDQDKSDFWDDNATGHALAYNRVSAHNDPSSFNAIGKAGMVTQEAFDSQAAMYEVYDPDGT